MSQPRTPGTRRRRLTLGALSALIAAAGIGLAACGSSGGSDGTLNLVAYSTPQDAYAAIIPAWQKTSGGSGYAVTQSYGASGDQSRAVAAGQPADVVNFATAPDLTRLVKAGLVRANWNANAYDGIVTDSVVVFIVRKGNPKHITTWQDLVKPGVSVITPNPISSGGARWNILAAYGSQLVQGKTNSEATAYLKELFSHVAVQDTSARAALTTFENGEGDVLLDYESEAIFAQQHGAQISYVVPPQTILIQTPAAVISTSKHLTAADNFLNYLWSPQAQTVFALHGFRPVVPSVAAAFANRYPQPEKLFTITLFGGWTSADAAFFTPNTGLVARVQQH